MNAFHMFLFLCSATRACACARVVIQHVAAAMHVLLTHQQSMKCPSSASGPLTGLIFNRSAGARSAPASRAAGWP